MKGWEELELGDCINFLNGFAFKSDSFTDNKDDLVLIKGENLGKGVVLWDISKYWNKADEAKLEKYVLKPFDILLAMDRPWVGGSLKYAYLKKSDPKAVLVQRVGCIRAKDGYEQAFLRYVIASEAFSLYIKNIMSGVAVPHISPSQIKSFKLNIPSVLTQRRIASILSAYDDLIENNLKRIKLLEELAQRTYEEWFVKFRINDEQLAVKAETGLPEGWERRKLVDVAILTMGQSPKSEFYNKEEKGLPFHQGVTDYEFRFPKNSTWTTEGNRFAEKNDILFSVRAPVGRLNIAIEKIVLGRGLSSIRHKKGHNSALYYQLQSIFFKDDLMGGGSIFNSVTKNDVEKIEIIEVDFDTSAKFNAIVESIDKQIENLTRQNRHLKTSRDLLLPRLMNGSLSVTAAE